MSYEPRCTRCSRPVFGKIEVEMLFCNRCADDDIEQHNRRQEWEHFHPGELMPSSEKDPRP